MELCCRTRRSYAAVAPISTCNFFPGLVVPMPTLPEESITTSESVTPVEFVAIKNLFNVLSYLMNPALEFPASPNSKTDEPDAEEIKVFLTQFPAEFNWEIIRF